MLSRTEGLSNTRTWLGDNLPLLNSILFTVMGVFCIAEMAMEQIWHLAHDIMLKTWFSCPSRLVKWCMEDLDADAPDG